MLTEQTKNNIAVGLLIAVAIGVVLYAGSIQSKYQTLLHNPTTNTVYVTNEIYFAPIQVNTAAAAVATTNWILSLMGCTTNYIEARRYVNYTDKVSHSAASSTTMLVAPLTDIGEYAYNCKGIQEGLLVPTDSLK